MVVFGGGDRRPDGGKCAFTAVPPPTFPCRGAVDVNSREISARRRRRLSMRRDKHDRAGEGGRSDGLGHLPTASGAVVATAAAGRRRRYEFKIFVPAPFPAHRRDTCYR